ncbi:MAG: hypothetical protein JL50_21495 [Peptococcaceae bacterium BICA1-7]|nr:MAG: hypothetical protein JL50_21495 [Peptococcaceae bacterium BICA1-7]HBV97096.1 hypothetical protein [Desulfotomaculum sp.]
MPLPGESLRQEALFMGGFKKVKRLERYTPTFFAFGCFKSFHGDTSIIIDSFLGDYSPGTF